MLPASDWGWRAYSGAQASLKCPLIQNWLRESDAGGTEGQVGKPGRVPPEGEMVLLRETGGSPDDGWRSCGGAWTVPDQVDPLALFEPVTDIQPRRSAMRR